MLDIFSISYGIHVKHTSQIRMCEMQGHKTPCSKPDYQCQGENNTVKSLGKFELTPFSFLYTKLLKNVNIYVTKHVNSHMQDFYYRDMNPQ
jgi:hypothetical protein